MKLLFITDNKIKGFGGGSLGGKKYYDALRTYCNKLGHELEIISLDNDFEEKSPIEVYKNKNIDMLSRLMGHSTYLYYILKNKMDSILKSKPDIIFLGRSRLGFIAKYIKKVSPNTKIVTFIDNVEYDYVDSYFLKKTSLFGRLSKWLEKKVVKNDEFNSIKFSDKIVYLTNRDKERVQSLYSFNDNNPTILPVCLPEQQELVLNSPIKNIYFIGSLNYGANIDAVERFIDDVWLPYFKDNSNIKFTVAGSNPTEDIKLLVNKANNIQLIENFEDVKDFISKKSLMIAPIEKGAGMKVKVADTLSMGLMIAASDEALVGYEDAIKNDSLNGIVRANSAVEYQQSIESYLNLESSQLEDIEKQNKNLFDKFYSFNRSRKTIEDIINALEV